MGGDPLWAFGTKNLLPLPQTLRGSSCLPPWTCLSNRIWLREYSSSCVRNLFLQWTLDIYIGSDYIYSYIRKRSERSR